MEERVHKKCTFYTYAYSSKNSIFGKMVIYFKIKIPY
jgi:hypothetical protein